MTTPSTFRDLPSAIWIALAFALLAAAIVIHAVFPRYQFEVIDNGHVMMIYDRWGGRFQRANYDEKGVPTLTQIVTPF